MSAMARTCEAQAMDFGRFESIDDTVPICTEPAEIEVQGYWLCRGCAEALELISGVADRIAEANGIETATPVVIPEERPCTDEV
jgi:hypothetical protein